VNVQVADGLPGRGAIVDANVVAGRTELRLELLLRRLKQVEHRLAFLGCRIEERRHMTDGDHQRVPRRYRVGIAKGDRGVVTKKHAFLRQGAERALGAGLHERRA
jgi:hypothetical protein